MADPHRLPPSLGPTAPLVPPLYQSAVYTLPDLDALEQVASAQQPGFIYARDAHPNARHLAAQLAHLEAAHWALVTGSGMAAITAIVLTVVKQGERIVASHRLYGRTTQLLQQELPRLGIEATLVDVGDLAGVRQALSRPARLLLVETVSNPLLRVADLEALVRVAHEHDCLVAVDNTFATPALTRPLELGADLVMESLTKMIGGHSDVTVGLVAGRGEQWPGRMSQVSSIWGLASNPFDCWLAGRGLATLGLRMKAACANAARLADWLAEQPGVRRVVYPGRPDHPDHALAARVLRGGFGSMLCFELAGGREAVNHFMRGSGGIPFSPSLGDTMTTCSHPATTSHRYLDPQERQRQGIGDGLVRLSVGVEELEEIQRELAKGLR